MRWLSQLLVILAICLVAIALPAAPAQAVCVPYDIEVSPKSGLPGTNVTVSGHDFYDDKLVDIYYDDILVATGRTDSSGDFTLNFTVPEDCSGHYQVLADVGYVEVDTYFTVRPGLIISPEKGPAGTNVTVKGQGFARNEEGIELYFDGESVESGMKANAQGSWQTNFQIPSSTQGEHKLDAQGAVSRLYEVIDATFRVTAEISLDKSSGTVGDTITMTGSRFAISEKGIQILFDGQALVTGIKANSRGEWQATFQVPEMSAGEHSVTAKGEQTQAQDVGELSFEIKPEIMLSPDEGHVGMNLTVTGHGFAPKEDVDITYDGSVVATAKTDDEGNFEAGFSVPESQHGERVVAAGYSGENHVNAIFTMESDAPPKPTLVSPVNGSRLGIMGKVTPTFEWSAVSDESGVHYSLQIATSDNFAASSVIVSITGLTETSYTPDKALPNGTYYWIVQAVDGAENKSDWTAARSFRAGFLPMWGFIVIIVAIVVLLVALIRALVVRRTIYYDRW